MKILQCNKSDQTQMISQLPGCLKCCILISIFLCLLFSANAQAYENIFPLGHRPARSGDQEEIPNLPDGALFESPFSEAIETIPGLNVILTPLIRYWMPSFGPGGDYMTSVKGRMEYLLFGTVNEGTLYYVNARPEENTIPLYRLLSMDLNLDYMVSNTDTVPGYLTETLLGYPFASANDAMAPIKQLVKTSPVDHLTAFYGEKKENYLDDGIVGYGYPRFGENDGEGKIHNPVLLQIDYNGVTISSDLSWGGVIYSLWWNGKQFVNHNDCGREIQTALFKPGLSDIAFGPTEAGDRMYHGSPIAAIQLTKKSLYTRSFPLQWDPRSYGGGTSNPVLYGGEFDRRARFMLHPFHKIIRYTVGYKPAESTNYLREWVTAYLNLDVSDRFFLNTAKEGTQEIPMPPDSQFVMQFINEGAIITSSADLNYAIGFFTPSPAYVSWYNFDGQGSFSEKTRKINILDTDAYMQAGTWYRRTVYLLVGSLNEVQDAISFLRTSQRFSPDLLIQDLPPGTDATFDNSTD